MASIFQNLIDSGTFPVTKVGRAVSRAYQQIAQDEAFQAVNLTAANTAADEITVAAQHGAGTNGGNYSITVSIPTWGTTYTTANIAWNATAGDIETALDAASPATVTNGDINVAESGVVALGDGNATFTCSGTVASLAVLITTANVALSGGAATVGAVTRSTAGRPDRNAMQALIEKNVIDGTVPDCGEANADWALPTTSGDYIGWWRRARLETINFLADQMYLEDGNATNREAVKDLYNLPEAL